MVHKIRFNPSAGWGNKHTTPRLFQNFYPKFKAAGQVQATKLESKNHKVSATFQKL